MKYIVSIAFTHTRCSAQQYKIIADSVCSQLQCRIAPQFQNVFIAHITAEDELSAQQKIMLALCNAVKLAKAAGQWSYVFSFCNTEPETGNASLMHV